MRETELILPPRLGGLLSKSPELNAAVLTTIETFRPLIESNKLLFFPDYTDHGPGHLSLVWQLCEELISEEAWATNELLTPEDAACLLLTTLLHDIGMHMTGPSFVDLVSGRSKCLPVERFGDKHWDVLWHDYLQEARRFDSKQRKRIFGADRQVAQPSVEPDEWNVHDRRLIGEFLRRHHATLAHHVALFGLTAAPGVELALPQTLSAEFRALIGHIARSHGMTLRDALSHLADRSHSVQHLKTHTAFCMVILRCADYLDIQADRASSRLLDLLALKVPFSRAEWNTHIAVREVKYHIDPSALEIFALPIDVIALLKLREWLSSYQAELDVSWAVLGEVYGRYDRQNEQLNRLGLRIRRIASNVDSDESFHRTLPDASYLPRKFEFKSNHERLLPLLVGPLYGDDPAYGVRELIANAIDAVLERRARLGKEMAESDYYLQDYDILVEVKSAGSDWLFSITDKGVGMNSSIISDYFLNAGASFRGSLEWRDSFTDDQGHALVRKVGRFGIGVLSAFLIGDKITVTTRRLGSSSGLTFSCSLGDDSICVSPCECPLGTRIEIAMSRKTREVVQAKSLYSSTNPYVKEWMWSGLKDPSFCLRDQDGKDHLPNWEVPFAGDKPPRSWHRLQHADFDDILWTYRKAPRLSCNGIRIGSSGDSSLEFIGATETRTGQRELLAPNVCVFDSDANLPLNLTRNGLVELPSFVEDLKKAVAHDILEVICQKRPVRSVGDFVEICCKTKADVRQGWKTPFSTDTHKALLAREIGPDRLISPLVFSSRGLLPTDGHFFYKYGVARLWLLPLFYNGSAAIRSESWSNLSHMTLGSDEAFACVYLPDDRGARHLYLQAMGSCSIFKYFNGAVMPSGVVYIDRGMRAAFEQSRTGRPTKVFSRLTGLHLYGDGALYGFGDTTDESKVESSVYRFMEVGGGLPSFFAMGEVRSTSFAAPQSLLARAWIGSHGYSPL